VKPPDRPAPEVRGISRRILFPAAGARGRRCAHSRAARATPRTSELGQWVLIIGAEGAEYRHRHHLTDYGGEDCTDDRPELG